MKYLMKYNFYTNSMPTESQLNQANFISLIRYIMVIKKIAFTHIINYNFRFISVFLN